MWAGLVPFQSVFESHGLLWGPSVIDVLWTVRVFRPRETNLGLTLLFGIHWPDRLHLLMFSFFVPVSPLASSYTGDE